MSEYEIHREHTFYQFIVLEDGTPIAKFKRHNEAQLLIDALEFKGVDPDCSLIKEQAS